MKNLTQLKNVSYITAIMYTALIGIGMYTTYHIYGIRYGESQMVKPLVWFELVMTIFALFMAKKYFSWQALGFGKINFKNMLWFVPMLVIGTMMIVYLGYFAITHADSITLGQWKLFYLVCVTTFLVGFSEELVYRGIVFAAFIKESKVKAVFISAITFSLLHSVNVFGGLAFGDMLGQLGMTLISGLFYAFVRLKINNIIPIIIFHWFWDFGLMGGQVLQIGETNNMLTSVFLVFEIVFVCTYLPYWVYKEMKKNKIKDVQPTAVYYQGKAVNFDKK